MDYRELKFTRICFIILLFFIAETVFPYNKESETRENQKMSQPDKGWLGVRVADLGHFIRNQDFIREFEDIIICYTENEEIVQGIAVIEVLEESPAWQNGILPGYIIQKVQRINIDNARTFSFLISNISPGETIELELWHPRGNFPVYVKIGKRPEDMPRPNNSLNTTR